MRFMLLLYGDESARETVTPERWREVIAAHVDFTRRLREAGAFVDSAPLEPTAAARSVRFDRGKRLVTDGPFAETKEQLGGYYLVEAESLDDAVRWAESFATPIGTIEVRPIWNLNVESPPPGSS
jgi:hypothetical protein